MPSRGVGRGHCPPTPWDSRLSTPSLHPDSAWRLGSRTNATCCCWQPMAEPEWLSAWLGLPSPQQIGSYQGLGTPMTLKTFQTFYECSIFHFIVPLLLDI